MTGHRPASGLASALVFDLDGTLVDSTADITRALNRMLAELGEAPVTRQEVAPLLGEGSASLVRNILVRARGNRPAEALVSSCTQRYLTFYAEAPARDSELYDGVAPALAMLAARGVPMGVCTNKDEALAVEVLRLLGVLRHFACVVGGDSLPARKPDPLPLITVMRQLSATPVTTALVGDSPIDQECALRAGVAFHLVPWASAGIPGPRLGGFADLLSRVAVAQQPTSPPDTPTGSASSWTS